MTIKTGHIPTKVSYIYGKSETVAVQWEDLEVSTPITEEVVTPSFCIEPNNEGRRKTALRWLEIKSRGTEASELERENEPFRIRICSLEVRERGGRAYKVVTEDKFYFDLREDVLLEAILNCGVNKGGEINGTFIWAIVSGQMKLIRFGSALHSTIIETGKIRDSKTIKVSDMTPGSVYQNRKGDRFIYLGQANTIEYKFERSIEPSFHNDYKSAPAKAQRHERSKELLILNLPEWLCGERSTKKLTAREFLTEQLVVEKSLLFFEFKKSVTAVKQLETIRLPDEIFLKVRNAARRLVEANRANRNGLEHWLGTLAYYSELLNVQQFPQLPTIAEQFVEFVELFEPYLESSNESSN